MATIQSPLPARCRFRLYGGWFDGVGFSRSAQRVSVEVQAEFPTTLRWSNAALSGTSLVSVEMAYSLEVDPNRHICHTVRTRSFGARVDSDPSVHASCTVANCPVKHVVDFLAGQQCPTHGCNVTQADLLRKTEQKLVDTMIVSDLLYLTMRNTSGLVVVSSDDDLWPGIRTSIGLGGDVALLHTRKRRTLPGEYTIGLTSTLRQLNL